MKSEFVWVDFENTPQVLFLEPLVRQMRAAGHEVRVTAKPQAQTIALAKARQLDVVTVGGGNFRGLLAKVLGNGTRALSLARWARAGGRPRVLLSSSRSATIAARLCGATSIGFIDYEHSAHGLIAMLSEAIWMPDVLRSARLPRSTRRVVRFYEGLKENLYLDDWTGDRDATRAALDVGERDFFVVTRPPAEYAHYASDRSMVLWRRVMRGLLERPDARVFILPRDADQESRLAREFGDAPGARVARTTVEGPALVNAADLVVGGGGTMNREAAVLGTPAWSTFSGPRPHVDDCLASEGRLTWVLSDAAASAALATTPTRRERRGPYPAGLRAIMQHLITTISRA